MKPIIRLIHTLVFTCAFLIAVTVGLPRMSTQLFAQSVHTDELRYHRDERASGLADQRMGLEDRRAFQRELRIQLDEQRAYRAQLRDRLDRQRSYLDRLRSNLNQQRVGLHRLRSAPKHPIVHPTATVSESSASEVSDYSFSEARRQTQTYLERVIPFGFGGSVGLRRADEVIVLGGYGTPLAKPESPFTSHTRLPIASLTKQFTAAAVLRLTELGLLDLETTIGDILDDVPDDKSGITVRQLLEHRSGLPGDVEAPESVAAPYRFIRTVLDAPLEFAPGSAFAYSNAGYDLLAAIVEGSSGTAYRSFVRDQLFQPAGLEHTGFDDETAWGGSSGIISTAEDLLTWMDALTAGHILQSETVDNMITPGADTYALGWRVAQSDRFGTVVYHGGDIGSYSSEIRWYKDEEVLLVYLDDRRLRGAVVNRILRPVLGMDLTLPPATIQTSLVDLQSAAGRFVQSDGLGAIQIHVENDALVAGAVGQDVIDALGLNPSDERPLVDSLNRRTSSMLSAIDRGDFTDLVDAFSDRIPDELVRDAVRDEWASYTTLHGPFDSSIILGTSPSQRDTYYTFARLVFEHGTEFYRFEWTHDQVLLGIRETDSLPQGRDTLPATYRYHPASNNSLVGYDMLTERVLQIRLVRGPDARVVAVRPVDGAGQAPLFLERAE